jgi:hypothetical protein
MFLGLGFGNDMISRKKFSVSGRVFEMVSGFDASRFRRIRFFSSMVNRVPRRASRRKMASTEVT